MSGGGTWLSQNSPRVQRPGAYINFTSIARPMIFLGERGTSTGLVEVPWYRPEEVVTVNGMDFLTGRALRHVGVTAFDEGDSVKHLSLLLSACIETKIMSANTGGAKAAVTIPVTGGRIELEAQKFGTFGNDILVSIQSLPVAPGEDPQWLFSTHIVGHVGSDLPRVNQTVRTPQELQNNDFIAVRVYDESAAASVRATASLLINGGSIEVESVNFGGNDITIEINQIAIGQYEVITRKSGMIYDTQIVAAPADLANNPYVTFTIVEDVSGTSPDFTSVPETGLSGGVESNFSFVEVAGVPLTGGNNGTVNIATRTPSYLRKIKNHTWQCMGWHWPQETHKQLVQQFVRRMRDENGLYVQVSMATQHANHESVNNVRLEHGGATNPITGERFTIDEVALMHASMTAGADIITSNTNTPLPIQLEFDYEFDNAEIIDGLLKGLVMFTRRRNGIIKIEQDINSLHTFTPTKNREFRKNNILRKLDEIGTTIRSTWENFFMGNEINDEIGRDLYKAQVDTYFYEMQGLRALTNHSIENLTIRQGNEPDAVVMDVIVQPTDAMERLFLTVHVSTGVLFARDAA